MNCKQAENLFDAYKRGTLQDTKALEEHLANCESCKKSWELYQLFFADTAIEQDFPVPNQLNAKIKYTLQQAKNKKKIPFYRQKQVLSYATACCFLLMAGLWGTSHYQSLKNEITPSVVTNEVQTDLVTSIPTESPVPEMVTLQSGAEEANQLKRAVPAPPPAQTQAPVVQSQPEEVIKNEAAQNESTQNEAAMLSDTSYGTADHTPAVVSDETNTLESDKSAGSGGGGGSASVYARQTEEVMPMTENLPHVTVSQEHRLEILENYRHVELSENVYAVTIIREELENILQITIDIEEKTEYIIEFTVE